MVRPGPDHNQGSRRRNSLGTPVLNNRRRQDDAHTETINVRTPSDSRRKGLMCRLHSTSNPSLTDGKYDLKRRLEPHVGSPRPPEHEYYRVRILPLGWEAQVCPSPSLPGEQGRYTDPWVRSQVDPPSVLDNGLPDGTPTSVISASSLLPSVLHGVLDSGPHSTVSSSV